MKLQQHLLLLIFLPAPWHHNACIYLTKVQKTPSRTVVSDNNFVMFKKIMTYIAYVTVQSDHGKKLDEHGSPCYVEANIWMIVANILISQIYNAHPMVVVIHNYWNPDMNFTTFSPDLVHVALVLSIHSWSPPKKFLYPTITFLAVIIKNTGPLSIHQISKVPDESTLQNISLKSICLSSISLTF